MRDTAQAIVCLQNLVLQLERPWLPGTPRSTALRRIGEANTAGGLFHKTVAASRR
jgi:hypothetical protein